MEPNIVPLKTRGNQPGRWTQGELAEFYRVEAALITVGMRIETDHGVTDEGDPWFVFCHVGGEQDVIIHFAHIGHTYLVSAPNMGGVFSGNDFRELVQRLLAHHKATADRCSRNDNIVIHPSAMLWVLIALAFLKSGEARAFGGEVRRNEPSPLPTPLSDKVGESHDPVAGMSTYALQPIMGAWGSSLCALAAITQPPSNRLNILDFQLDSRANHDGSASDPDPVLTAPSRLGHSGQEIIFTSEAQASSGSSASATTAEALAAPIPGAGEHAIAPLLLVSAPPEPGPHGPLEINLFQISNGNVASVLVNEKEAIRVLTAVNGLGNNANTVNANAAPDAIAKSIDQAVHLSGDPGKASAELQRAAVASASKATAGGTQTASSDTHADAAATAVGLPSAANSAPVSAAAPPLPSATTPNTEQQKMALALSALHEFMIEVPVAKTLVLTGATIVVYDPAAVDKHPAELSALTFDFNDGSHISLVGLPGELVHVL